MAKTTDTTYKPMVAFIISILLSVFSPLSFASGVNICGVRNLEPFVHGVPEDYADWVKQRAYANEEERQMDLADAILQMDKSWQKRFRDRDLSKNLEDRVLAAFLLKSRTASLHSRVEEGKKALKLINRNARNPSSVNYSSVYANFFLLNINLSKIPSLKEMEENEKQVQQYLNRIEELKAIKQTP